MGPLVLYLMTNRLVGGEKYENRRTTEERASRRVAHREDVAATLARRRHEYGREDGVKEAQFPIQFTTGRQGSDNQITSK